MKNRTRNIVNTNKNINGGNHMNTSTNNTKNIINGGNDMKKTGMEEFVSKVREAVAVELGEGYEVTVQSVLKNNGLHLTGLCIHSEHSSVAPNIYLDGMFKHYQAGEMDIQDACHKVTDIYEASKLDLDFDISMVNSFDSVRDRLCYKLVNAERNAELLKDVPHRIVCEDLALIYYLVVNKGTDGIASTTVRNSLFSLWDTTEAEMYEAAINNTMHMFRGSVRSIQSVLMDLMTVRMDAENAREFFDMCISDDDMMPLYVCTNSERLNGAGTMLYPGLLQEFAEKVDDDVYILPSSIHEVLFVPAGFMQPEELVNMVCAVNATEVSPDEVLSDSVYCYRRADGCITKV